MRLCISLTKPGGTACSVWSSEKGGPRDKLQGADDREQGSGDRLLAPGKALARKWPQVRPIARYNVLMAEPTAEELKARIAELEQKLTSRKSRNLEFRVSEKGGVSVYGLGRFPVTLYYEQWTRLLGAVDELRAFIDENKHRLKTKDAE
jgi:hypothetical protein